ncbi:MAG: YidC/Oxa1 family membrane protein insertase [Saccharofermentans sp.]|nr:YidC/Oxa1 family membrane protein insertase [Saccharofermentans sp.]
MQFFSELYALIIGPIELVFEIIFSVLNKHIHISGVNIMLLSLVFSLIVLPLYMRADKIQEEARDAEERLGPVIKHIKQYFKGDERFMILQTYYRQNDYSPLSVLKSSVSLMLQIPFFLAAYRMLHDNMYLVGSSFGPIKDLGSPDALIAAGSVTINVLPFVMTAVNLLSAAVYANKMPFKSKVQLFIMAALFLVLLYNSPAGMVLYWTCNNLFSLVKNIVMKIVSGKKKPASVSEKPKKAPKDSKGYKGLFIFSCIACAALTGIYLPMSVLSASPEEFVDMQTLAHPMVYVLRSIVMATGLFVIWPSVFRAMSSQKGRKVISFVMFALAAGIVVNSHLFSNGYGMMSNVLVYDVFPVFDTKTKLLSLAATIGAAAVAVVIAKFGRNIATVIALSMALVFAGLGISKTGAINRGYIDARKAVTDNDPEFTLSKNGKNVVVLMLDRALGPMIPYLFNENKSLGKSFDGFTYYHNTMSYGAYTNFATPALYGGYEYTPERVNERSSERLVDKQNEALKVMPVMFSKAGFNATIVNPSYAGYKWNSDLTVFDGLERVSAYNTLFRYVPVNYGESYQTTVRRNLFCYSLYKGAPVALQPYLYDNGTYNETSVTDWSTAPQVQRGSTIASGHNKEFEAEYWAVNSLDKMTKIDEGSSNNYLFFNSRVAHEEQLLQEPEYAPADHVNNTKYDQENKSRFKVNGKMMLMIDSVDYQHYQVNMAGLMAVAKWLDYLKANDCYDNTRIIIVSDHGFGLSNFSDLLITGAHQIDAEWFTPLLMVKDFGSRGELSQSEEFMTNADTPYLASQGVIENPVNPFTGKAITNDAKNGEQKIIYSGEWGVDKNNGNTFKPGQWYSVKENIWKKGNWKYLGGY